MHRLYLLCKVDVLLPDTEFAKSHVETYTYVVNPSCYSSFVGFIEASYDFYGITKCGNLISHLPQYVHKDFVRL